MIYARVSLVEDESILARLSNGEVFSGDVYMVAEWLRERRIPCVRVSMNDAHSRQGAVLGLVEQARLYYLLLRPL